MPTYEYACRSCAEHLEVVQSFSDDPLTTCPACGGELRKVFGAIGIAFKGSGFYRNDSRPREKSESGADGAKESKGGKEAKEAKEAKEDTGSSSSETKAGSSSEARGSKASSGSTASS